MVVTRATLFISKRVPKNEYSRVWVVPPPCVIG